MRVNFDSRPPISVTSYEKIPFYAMLAGYEWVDDYCELEAALEEYKALKKEKEKVEQAPMAKKDLLKQLRGFWEGYEAHRIEALARFLSVHRKTVNADPFRFIQTDPNVKPRLPWEDIEAAVNTIDFSDGVSDAMREKELRKIRERLEVLKKRIADFRPPHFFCFKDGRVECDIREEFVDYWREKQARVNGPINPQGLLVWEGPEEEGRAWLKLIGKDSINPHAPHSPNSNEE
jgi:hypothetical protein